MKIAVKFDQYFIADADKIPAILAALASGELYEASGWDISAATVFTKTEYRPSIYFVEDTQFAAPPEPFVKLQEDLKRSESRWYEQYQMAQSLQKELNELKAAVAAAKEAL